MKKQYDVFKICLFISVLFLCWSCSRLMKKVKDPGDGKIIGNNIAIIYSSHYQINLGGLEKLHPFDIHKYAKIYKELAHKNVIKSEHIYVPDIISRENIQRVHSNEFLNSLKKSYNVAVYLEAPIIAKLPVKIVENGVLKPFQYAVGGTLLASRLALQFGIGINIGGGFHHAKPDKGEGFCVFADIPIAVKTLKAEKKVKKILIIDLDVHQGNGTVVCLADDKDVFTFSMHQKDIYPVPKEKSSLDIGLERGTDDTEYHNILHSHLNELFKHSDPDIVYLIAGCDTLAGDELGSLQMTENGIIERDTMVIDACYKRNIPVVMTLGGGYSKNAWKVQFNSICHIIQTFSQK